MKRTAAGLGIVALLAMWVATPVGAQELAPGTWTGTLSPPQNSPSVAVTLEVGETDGALSIVMSAPGEESIVFRDVKLNGDELTFWWQSGGGIDCTLLRKEDGSFEGICAERRGPEEGTLTMLPPSGEDSS